MQITVSTNLTFLGNLDGSFKGAFDHRNIPLDITVVDIVQKHKPFYPTFSVSRIIPTTGPSYNNSESILTL